MFLLKFISSHVRYKIVGTELPWHNFLEWHFNSEETKKLIRHHVECRSLNQPKCAFKIFFSWSIFRANWRSSFFCVIIHLILLLHKRFFRQGKSHKINQIAFERLVAVKKFCYGDEDVKNLKLFSTYEAICSWEVSPLLVATNCQPCTCAYRDMSSSVFRPNGGPKQAKK